MNLTQQQQNVVQAGLSDLLVSAAAGSGKTMVLVERIASRIVSGELNVRNMLVMTFTKAAAAHMSSRLEAALGRSLDFCNETAKRQRLSEQIAFLPLAHISTIHSFCNDVINNFGTELQTENGRVILEPGSRILDEAKMKQLLDESIDEVFDRTYALCHRVLEQKDRIGKETVSMTIGDPDEDLFVCSLSETPILLTDWCADFMRMTHSFGSVRDDESLKEMLLHYHSSLRSLPDYESQIRTMIAEQAAGDKDLKCAKTAQLYLADFQSAIQRAAAVADKCNLLLENISVHKDSQKDFLYKGFIRDWLTLINELHETVSGEFEWDEIYRAASLAPTGKWPRNLSASSQNEDIRQLFIELIPVYEVMFLLTGFLPNKDVARCFSGLAKNVFNRSSADIQKESSFMRPVLSRFFEMVLLVDALYSSKKRKENGLDFADQEHMALFLLSKPDIRDYYREMFSEIYIDEYQDNSRIQDAIVGRFSKGNVFFVGDRKQSIYRFRHARPEMFANRSEKYSKGDGGVLLTLNSNFRSRPHILSFVNDIFSQIMSEESGEIAYDASHQLNPERENVETDDEKKKGVQILLIDATRKAITDAQSVEAVPKENGLMDESSSSDADEKLDVEKSEREAILVQAEIYQLREKTGGSWGDFAVLTKTNREASVIANTLADCGIPSQGPDVSAIFMQRELLLMQNLIRLLDNMRLDIPLCAVMRAPFSMASFTEEELLSVYLFAEIHMPDAQCYLEKLTLYAERGEEPLRGKTERFLSFLDELRTQSMYLKISELIERVYLKTGFMDMLQSQENGSERVEALEMFRDWANRYEKGRRGGLYGFARFIEDIENKQRSLEDFDTAGQLRDVVQCMSIHKSKGLEFKNVFVCGIESSFAGSRGTNAIVLNETVGAATDFVDPDAGYKYPSTDKILLDELEKRARLSEQMRLLYVAMTRAEDRLYLIGTFTRKKDGAISSHDLFIHDARTSDLEKLPAWMVRNAKSHLDFVLLGLSRNPQISVEALLPNDSELGCSPIIRTVSGRTPDLLFHIIESGEVDRMIHGAPDNRSPGELVINTIEDTPDFPELSDDETALFTLQISGEYEYEKLIRMPAKTTVTEMKRRLPPMENEEELLAERSMQLRSGSIEKRPVNLQLHGRKRDQRHSSELSPSETGILLHSVFQYLDFAALSESPSEQDIMVELHKMVTYRMIREDQIPFLRPYLHAIADFASSDICARMKRAEKKRGHGPFREIPFSITEPVAKEDFCLIQGMIDCWFIEDGQAILVDYKSDRIGGNRQEKEQILRERYGVQLLYYSRAIEAASQLCVREKLIWLIPEAISFEL